ncbi:MAG: SpaA isopeptide-forming pilin-related protein, partial [Atopobium minutum]|nr:SpaA isopeptide-forming pilin-related protein [Atopobium minutum]
VVYGDYTVVETKAPEGYVLDQTAKSVKVLENGKTVNVGVADAKIKGTVTVTKTDAGDKDTKLAGAEFELRQGDKVVDTQITDDNGVDTFKDVVYGEYTIVETKAPEGYVLDQKPLTVKIEKDKVLLRYEVKNTAIPAKPKLVIGILPKTGDTTSSIAPMLFASVAFAALAWTLRRKRRA